MGLGATKFITTRARGIPQPLPAPLNRRNLRFGYKEDVFCPEGCKPKED